MVAILSGEWRHRTAEKRIALNARTGAATVAAAAAPRARFFQRKAQRADAHAAAAAAAAAHVKRLRMRARSVFVCVARRLPARRKRGRERAKNSLHVILLAAAAVAGLSERDCGPAAAAPAPQQPHLRTLPATAAGGIDDGACITRH